MSQRNCQRTQHLRAVVAPPRRTSRKSIAARLAAFALLLSAVSLCAADLSPEGLWKTTDDKTGKPKGLVRIYQENGAFFGRAQPIAVDEQRQRIDLREAGRHGTVGSARLERGREAQRRCHHLAGREPAQAGGGCCCAGRGG